MTPNRSSRSLPMHFADLRLHSDLPCPIRRDGNLWIDCIRVRNAHRQRQLRSLAAIQERVRHLR